VSTHRKAPNWLPKPGVAGSSPVVRSPESPGNRGFSFPERRTLTPENASLEQFWNSQLAVDAVDQLALIVVIVLAAATIASRSSTAACWTQFLVTPDVGSCR